MFSKPKPAKLASFGCFVQVPSTTRDGHEGVASKQGGLLQPEQIPSAEWSGVEKISNAFPTLRRKWRLER